MQMQCKLDDSHIFAWYMHCICLCNMHLQYKISKNLFIIHGIYIAKYTIFRKNDSLMISESLVLV
ncbi:hypothetical protein D3C74_91780 [compost metagenome]